MNGAHIMAAEVAWNDVEAINALATEEFGEWGPSVEVTQDMINTFADVTGDHQWIHIDIDKANAGPFGGPIAHGFLTLSLLPALASDPGFEMSGAGNAVNYGADSLRFLAPVPAGSKVHARSRLVEARERKTGTLVITENAIHVEGNDTPSVLYKMMILYMGAM
jgi:acyl dehydratase